MICQMNTWKRSYYIKKVSLASSKGLSPKEPDPIFDQTWPIHPFALDMDHPFRDWVSLFGHACDIFESANFVKIHLYTLYIIIYS